jgi:hypothetical protein
LSFNGIVSGIQSQTIRTKLSATQAMLMNPIAPPQFPATRRSRTEKKQAVQEMVQKIAKLVGQVNDIRNSLLRRLDDANTFLAMLPPHRAWMLWGTE